MRLTISIVVGAFALGIAITVFLAFREMLLRYRKLDEILALLRSIDAKLGPAVPAQGTRSSPKSKVGQLDAR
jgi:hypothetical protein